MVPGARRRPRRSLRWDPPRTTARGFRLPKYRGGVGGRSWRPPLVLRGRWPIDDRARARAAGLADGQPRGLADLIASGPGVQLQDGLRRDALGPQDGGGIEERRQRRHLGATFEQGSEGLAAAGQACRFDREQENQGRGLLQPRPQRSSAPKNAGPIVAMMTASRLSVGPIEGPAKNRE